MKKLDFTKRPLSYSSISSFHYNPETWYRTYLLNERQSSREMTFGSMVDQKIQDDPSFIPTLPRYQHMQWEGKVVFNGIPLIGKADGLDFNNFVLADYKTGKKAWDQKRTDETDQLTMYLMLVYITKKILPEKFTCRIHWLPTVETGAFEIAFRDNPVVPITFETSRSMADILRFGTFINRTVKEMNDYVKNHI